MKKVFGIVSWLPDKEPDRSERIKRLNSLFLSLSKLDPATPILIIAQNWKDFKPVEAKNELIIKVYPCLGILKARQTLRAEFLKLDYNYIIMFDDDAIIVNNNNAYRDYLDLIEKNPKGFCFIARHEPLKYNPFADSQLNLCAISRYIYEAEDIPNVDAQKGEGFEDRVYSCLLYTKYKQFFFKAPAGLYCDHFCNPKAVLPSTWAEQKEFDWQRMIMNTETIEKYIVEHNDLPRSIHSLFTTRRLKPIQIMTGPDPLAKW